jgi:hypothetical protein
MQEPLAMDTHISARVEPEGAPRAHPLRCFLRVAALAAFASLALALVLFLPVAASMFRGMEAVIVDGEALSAAAFADRLVSLFLGLVVLSFGVVGFALSVLLTEPAATPVFRAARFRERPGTASSADRKRSAIRLFQELCHVRVV